MTDNRKLLYQISFEVIFHDITHCSARTIGSSAITVADEYISGAESHRIRGTPGRNDRAVAKVVTE